MTKDPQHLPRLQFAVLGILSARKLPGRDIRDELRALGLKKTGPTFYRLMTRLEESGMVEGWYEQNVVDGQIFRERIYRALPAGLRAWRKTSDFHVAVIGRFSEGQSETGA